MHFEMFPKKFIYLHLSNILVLYIRKIIAKIEKNLFKFLAEIEILFNTTKNYAITYNI